jgi:hypothetical protein
MRSGEYSGHHRGLRAEHVFKGVAWKLERANCLLVQSKCIRYLGRIANSEQTRDGLLAVLADHSTEGQMRLSDWEGGEVRPNPARRDTVGKEKPGITLSGANDGRDSEPTNRVTIPSESVSREALIQRPLRGSPADGGIMRQKECRLSGCTHADRWC